MRTAIPVLLFSVLGCLALVCAAGRSHAEDGGSVSGVVVDAKGQPVGEATVTLHVGWARYTLTDTFDRWLSVETQSAKTDAEGKFLLVDYPKGARTTAHVSAVGAVGVAQGTGELTVKLGPPGGVTGKVTGKRRDLKAMRIYVQGGMGLGTANGTVDDKTGKYVVGGITPGPARVQVLRDNWAVGRVDVDVKPGKPSKAKTVSFRGKYLPSDSPQVEVTTVRLVDGAGKPVADTRVAWSSRWMTGGSNSDKDGEVKLAGGGVSVGGPPYRVHLSSLGGDEQRFQGALKKIKRGVALIELKPLRKISGTVTQAGATVDPYRLLVVGPGKSAQVHHAVLKDGTFTVWVPQGACRFVVGTIDGKVQEQPIAITAETTTLEIKLNRAPWTPEERMIDVRINIDSAVASLGDQVLWTIKPSAGAWHLDDAAHQTLGALQAERGPLMFILRVAEGTPRVVAVALVQALTRRGYRDIVLEE